MALLSIVLGAPAFSQDETGEFVQDSSQDDIIVVTGIRRSLANALDRKQDSSYAADLIVATDIGKLPDTNLAEALQRISGIQIARDRGEGNSVSVRGLPQVITTINGRETFTADRSRSVNFEDLPSEMVQTLEVQKTRIASTITGGLAGTVNVLTLRPDDLDDYEFNFSANYVQPEFAEDAYPRLNALTGGNVYTDAGRFGWLTNFAYQDRQYRWDRLQMAYWRDARTNQLDLDGDGVFPNDPDDLISTPDGNWLTLSPTLGSRERISFNGIFDWSPQDDVNLYMEIEYRDVETSEDRNNNAFDSMARGSDPRWADVTVASNGDLLSGRSLNQQVEVNSQVFDKDTETFMAAMGAEWVAGSWSIKGDMSFITSDEVQDFATTRYIFRPSSESLDVFIDVSQPGTPYVDFLNERSVFEDPTNYEAARINETISERNRNQLDVRLDGEYYFDYSGTLIQFGARFATSELESNWGSRARSIPGRSRPTIDQLGEITTTTLPNFFNGNADGNINGIDFLGVDQQFMRANRDRIREVFGVETGDVAFSDNSYFKIEEDIFSPYVQVDFIDFFGFVPTDERLTGNIGARVEFQELTSITNSEISTRQETHFLPSFNVNWEVLDDVNLRAAAYQTLTRPDFDDLRSRPASTNSRRGTGSAVGNPDLEPVESDALDFSVEWYFAPGSLVSGAVFYKDVSGFVVRGSEQEVIDGITYDVTRPRNLAEATIKGFEFNYQHFYDFLPGPFSGLGAQFNYTYVDSESMDETTGETFALEGLSEHAYNVIALYEMYGIQARAAYSWRSEFVALQRGQGGRVEWTAPIEWLDLSIAYDIDDRFSVVLAASNVLDTVEFDYSEIDTHPRGYFAVDRSVSIGLRGSF
ncbi:TonB-dependent receptor [Maricaulis sp. D1M11]|uniref:TonB-dependent receptor n=1 Tax=Maricaulis sp. D1M11 TaxID=3076117 RepID=UPI0039B6B5AB